jgi:peptidoglycan/xylan/chitin deacetylase (PgdA/CDA1 family)
MAGILHVGGKRELLARGLLWSGASWVLSQLPASDSLLVLAYHRIGNPDEDLFDPGVFSATADEFNDQIACLKRQVSLVTLEEALAFVEGTIKERRHRCRVLITFDDGYLDNYQVAFPILRTHDVQGVFFLPTSMVGSTHVPWWDHIAYLMKTARRRRFSLHYPAHLDVDIDKNGMAESLRAVLSLFKKPENSDQERFIRELTEETKGEDLPGTLRRFLNWDEAREMIGGGMAIGSHTHSHQLLSQLEAGQQADELAKSRSILQQQLGIAADVLAYPVGAETSFTEETQRIARQLGYRCAFSHHGGKNLRGQISAYDVKRNNVGTQSWSRFQVQAAVCKRTGSYWP